MTLPAVVFGGERMRLMSNGATFSQPSVAALPQFMDSVEECRSACSEADWAVFCKLDRNLAGWREFLLDDPMTRHGFLKPRGYPGDAGLMDFFYRHPSIMPVVEAASEKGRAIYEVISGQAMSVSARRRIAFIAERMTEAAQGRPLSVLSFAGGHARELEQVDPAIVGAFLLIDSDPLSLAEAKRAHGARLDISMLNRNVLRLRPEEVRPADFVHSVGLFDYLEPRAAFRLIATMANAVRPGGTLLVGNLAETAANLGYCEAIMDWWMLPRTEREMAELGTALRAEDGWSFSLTHIGCFRYLVGQRAAT